MPKPKAPMRLRREELKLSRSKLSKKLEIAEMTITKWEHAWYNPSANNYAKLAEFYGVGITELMQEHDDWRAGL